jgi:hypothetical protein
VNVIGVSSPKPVGQQEVEGLSQNLIAPISEGVLGPVVEESDVVLLINCDNGLRSNREEARQK